MTTRASNWPDAGPGRPWRLLADDDAPAAEGLALDEALMAGYSRDNPPPPTLRLYTYRSHCALVGRYQNLEAEIDLEACRSSGTEVSRRPTGGGAIIMGRQQLGVALVDVAPVGLRPREIIERLSEALIAGLAGIGIGARFRGKNDLEVSGRKIVGIGLYLNESGAMLFHASLLADLDVPFMLRVLRIPAAKLADKALAAVQERVTTVSELTGQSWDGAALRPVIAEGFARRFGVQLDAATPVPEEQALAARLAGDRYRARSWLAGRSLVDDGSGTAVVKTPAGLARIYLTTHGDLVKSMVVVGDFNELPPAVVDLENALRWRRLDEDTVSAQIEACGTARALDVAPDRLAAAVLAAGRLARRRLGAAPVRAAGSCYFPEPSSADVVRTG